MKKILLLKLNLLFQMVIAMCQIQPGVVIDSIICLNNSDQSYAAFLPSRYDEQRKWPIIYFFDPEARGSEPVKRYSSIAEELGYIIVCSNNSRNGPMSDSYMAADAVFQDTGYRFSIDENRIYTSGFSGGSRVALAIAINTNQIAGVFGIGATEPVTPDVATLRKKDFKYVGLVGILDKNYDEHKRFKDKLDRLTVPNILITSTNDHEWASSNDFRLGILWIQENRNELLAEAIKNKLNEGADSIPVSERYALAALAGQITSNEMQFTIDPKVSQRALKTENKLLKKEYALKKVFFDSITYLLSGVQSKKQTLDWIQLTALRLQKMKEKENSFAEKAMYHRVLSSAWGRAFEQARLDIPQQRFDRALIGMDIYYSITKNILTTNWWKARIYSLMGRTEECLKCLESMLQQGFKRTDLFYSNPDLENVRSTKAFKELLERFSQ